MTRHLTVGDFRRAARERLSRMAYDYYRSGADAQVTLRANLRAYRQYEIWYRVLCGVEVRSLETTVLGTPVAFPILIAPTAYQRLAHPDGELATARAAAELGTVVVVSTLATCTMEAVAAAATGPRWFQLYVHRDRGLTRSLVERAVAAGYGALVVTVDTPMLGRRLADERNGFALPPGLTMANFPGGGAAASGDDDGMDGGAAAGGDGGRAGGAGAVAERRGSELANYFAARHDASLTWRELDWLRSLCSLPLVVKGIVRPDDAVRAIEHGAQAVIVSNHGGRQLDGAPATLTALPGVVDAIAGRAEVLLDGGIRWGTDVLKALGLGARAVLVGRPILWGLAVNGQAGVAEVLALLRDELSRAMALSGCPAVGSIDRDLIRRIA
jgi:4-hydroxymandelate oxidase